MSEKGNFIGGAVAAGIGGLGALGYEHESAAVDQLNTLADKIGAGQVDLTHAVNVDGVVHSGLDPTALMGFAHEAAATHSHNAMLTGIVAVAGAAGTAMYWLPAMFRRRSSAK